MCGIGGSFHMVPNHPTRKEKMENRPLLTASVINLSLFNLIVRPLQCKKKYTSTLIDDISSQIHGENQVKAGKKKKKKTAIMLEIKGLKLRIFYLECEYKSQLIFISKPQSRPLILFGKLRLCRPFLDKAEQPLNPTT